MLWNWDASRIVALARQCFRKTAKGVLLRKPNKPDYSQVKSYRVISLLNCLGKVVEKIAAEAISDHCEATGALHPGQIGSRKDRSDRRGGVLDPGSASGVGQVTARRPRRL
jgi:hypothetical protein